MLEAESFYPPTPAGAAQVKSRRVGFCLSSRQEEVIGFKSWLHRHPPTDPTTHTAFSASPALPHSPPSSSLQCVVLPSLPHRPQRFAHPLYVVTTLPHCPHRSSLTHPPTAPTTLSALSTPTTLSASPSHSASSPPSPSLPPPLTAFTPLPLSLPGRAWLASLPLVGACHVFKKYLEASNVCPNPRRPHRPHRPQRFVHTPPPPSPPHRPHRPHL